MKLFYGKDIKVGGNLGDELNAWMFPKLFGRVFFDEDTSVYFMGIGSVLCADETYCRDWIDKRKLVFGTGVRPFHKQLQVDDSYDIKFLRGPLSAHTLGIKPESYITDGAYCLNLLPEFNQIANVRKKYEVGLIPYFKSQAIVDWQKICDENGFKLINPICSIDDIESRLIDIASCKFIVAEAMHGAILADILRIPWSRFVLSTYKYEQSHVAEFKWMDWMFSMNLRMPDILMIPLTNKVNHAVTKLSNNIISFNYILKEPLTERIIDALSINRMQFMLSDERLLTSKIEQLYNQVELVKRQYL